MLKLLKLFPKHACDAGAKWFNVTIEMQFDFIKSYKVLKIVLVFF